MRNFKEESAAPRSEANTPIAVQVCMGRSSSMEHAHQSYQRIQELNLCFEEWTRTRDQMVFADGFPFLVELC